MKNKKEVKKKENNQNTVDLNKKISYKWFVILLCILFIVLGITFVIQNEQCKRCSGNICQSLLQVETKGQDTKCYYIENDKEYVIDSMRNIKVKIKETADDYIVIESNEDLYVYKDNVVGSDATKEYKINKDDKIVLYTTSITNRGVYSISIK